MKAAPGDPSTHAGLHKLVAGYQVLAVLVFAAAALWPDDWSSIDPGRLLIAIALVLLGLLAGIRLWTGSASGVPLTILNQALQLLSIAAPALAWDFTPLFSAVLGVEIVRSELTLGLTLALEPLLLLERTGGTPLRIGIDLVPVVVLWLLLRFPRSSRQGP